MKEILIASYPDRTFKLWEYTASNDFLLLRSQKPMEGGLMIDLVFAVVDLVQIPTRFNGLAIEEEIITRASYDESDLYGQLPRHFSLISEGVRSVIVAGHCVI